ncbi:MAG TPA: hypothetical protein VJ969_00435 [Desulfopila sp.]|nr:hypothetical protein [Desulfopila sp.]
MLQDRNLIIIGGSGRNVGKTEFVCRLIARLSTTNTIYGLKISAIYPDEGIFHGNHGRTDTHNAFFEETRADTGKDTSRMLRAGAARVFYLRSEDKDVLSAYSRWRRNVPADAGIVCESNSLAKYVRPAIYIMIRKEAGEVKPRAQKMLELADMVVFSDGKSGFSDLCRLHLTAGGFVLDSEEPKGGAR